MVAYGGLVPAELLDLPTHGWVNLHFSLLPSWRGAAPVQAAIAAGDEVTGASTFRIEAGLDTGPVFGVVTERIRPTDTAGDLLGRLSETGAGSAGLDPRWTRGRHVDRGAAARPTGSAPRRRSPSTTPASDGTCPAHLVDRHIRAMTPAPGPWTNLGDLRVKIAKCSIVRDVDERPAPGELLVTKKALMVGTQTDPIRLDVVQPQGKKAMAGADWARGARLTNGQALS